MCDAIILIFKHVVFLSHHWVSEIINPYIEMGVKPGFWDLKSAVLLKEALPLEISIPKHVHPDIFMDQR